MTANKKLVIEIENGARPEILVSKAGKLTLKFTGAKGVTFLLDDEPQVFTPADERKLPPAAPYVITVKKSSDALKQIHDIGESVPNKGVYLHTVKPPRKFGIRLPEGYLWAAPKDLIDATGELLNYKETLSAIIKLKDFHGRDGIDPRPNKERRYENVLYQYWNKLAAGDDSVREGWVLPTREIVTGRAAPKEVVKFKQTDAPDIIVPNNLYSLRKKMPPGSEFITKAPDPGARVGGIPQRYWTCSEEWIIGACNVFFNGDGASEYSRPGDTNDRFTVKDNDYYLSARPVCWSPR